MVSIGEFPDYSPRHSQEVETAINQLLNDVAKEKLTTEEIFLLLCAVQFHRIGMLIEREPNEDIDVVLQDYPQRTYDYLDEHYADWQLERPEAQLIKQICLGLSAPNFRVLPKTQVLRKSRIRVQFLAALLRLGDLLDIDYTTVSRLIRKLRRLSPSSSEQLLKHDDIVGIDIDCESWTITITISPTSFDARNLLKQYIEGDLQNELDSIRLVLNENKLYYRTIEMVLRLGDVQRDERIVRTLKDFYRVAQPATRTTPYKYLDYFDPQDHDNFFGRQSDVERYLGYIRKNELIVMYGESGVGKTSLIRAGLIPRLINEGYIPVYGRCFDLPAEIVFKCTQEVVAQLDPTRPGASASTLKGFFQKQKHLGRRFVVFIDQFEEFFISPRFGPSDHSKFIDQLIDCLNHMPRLELTIVLSLRREYFVELGRFKTRLKELYDNAFELRKLIKEEVKDAIVEPASRLGIAYEPELIEKLVRDIYQEGEYNTPHIQIVCDKLIRSLEAPSARVISLDLYERLGRAESILRDYLKDELARFAPERREAVESILEEMVTTRGTKTVSTVEEIALHCRLPKSKVEALLSDLIDRRLLRKLEVQGKLVFELAHEFLVASIGIKPENKDLKETYGMLERQLTEHERSGVFLQRPLLARIERQRDRLALDDQQKAFIIQSYLESDLASDEIRFWIRSMQTSVGVAILVKTLDTENSTTYCESIRVLAELGEAVTDHLTPYLASANWQIRQGVIDALAGIGPSTANSMITLFGSDDRRTRRGAVTVLSKMGDPVRRLLEERLHSVDEQTAALIEECLSLMEFYAASR